MRYRRLIAGCLVLIFLVSGLQVPGGGASMAAISDLSIPASLGTVESYHQGASSKTVYYLQDAHDSFEAQKNIARLIHRLVEKQKIRTVYEEGYEGRVPTEQFEALYPDKEKRGKAALYLLDRLRLSAAEYAHLTRRRDFELFGGDSQKLHQRNIQAYRKAAKSRHANKEALAVFKTRLDTLAAQHFPAPFRSWQDALERFDTGTLDPFSYLKRSASLLQETGKTLPEKDFPESVRLLQGHIDIDSRKFFGELAALENHIAGEFLDADTQSVFRHQRTLKLLELLNNLRLTTPAYEQLMHSIDSLEKTAGSASRGLAEFIARLTKRPLVVPVEWEERLKSAKLFYETAEARSEALREPLAEFLASEENKTILVYGGFHKKGILSLLEKEGLSYVVIAPRIREPSERHEIYYRELMERGKLRNERLPAEAGWVTPERIFNVASTQDALRGYLEANLPQKLQPLRQRSEVRLGTVDVEAVRMQNVEVMKPDEFVARLYLSATHPLLKTDHASFLIDVLQQDVTAESSARGYVGYGPHGSLFLPFEDLKPAVRIMGRIIDFQPLARFFEYLQNRINRKLRLWGVSPSWRLRIVEYRHPEDHTGEEARETYFRGHFRVTAPREAVPDLHQVRLVMKPPYMMEEKYEFIKNLVIRRHLEEGLYTDLLNTLRFLREGGLPDSTPVELQEFFHTGAAREALEKFLQHDPDFDAYRTTLGEFLAKAPAHISANSEVRAAPGGFVTNRFKLNLPEPPLRASPYQDWYEAVLDSGLILEPRPDEQTLVLHPAFIWEKEAEERLAPLKGLERRRAERLTYASVYREKMHRRSGSVALRRELRKLAPFLQPGPVRLTMVDGALHVRFGQVRSEVRGPGREIEERTTRYAAWSLKQKKWKLPQPALLYPAAGPDGQTLAEFLKARPELTQAVAVDSVYGHETLGEINLLGLLRSLDENGIDVLSGFDERAMPLPSEAGERIWNLRIRQPWYFFWQKPRIVRLHLIAEDYFEWNGRERWPQGFGLTVIKNPGMGAMLTLPQMEGGRFFRKALAETTSHGVVYFAKTYLPSRDVLHENRIELMDGLGMGAQLWFDVLAGSYGTRLPDDAYWLARKNVFPNIESFFEHFDALDYDSVDARQLSPYLERVVRAMYREPYWLERLHTWGVAVSGLMSGFLLLVDVWTALGHLLVMGLPFISSSARASFIRHYEDRQFRQDAGQLHFSDNAARKTRILRWLYKRYPEQTGLKRQVMVRAILAASVQSPALAEGFRLYFEQHGDDEDAPYFDMLQFSQRYGGSLREMLYQELAREEDLISRRSEVRSQDHPEPPRYRGLAADGETWIEHYRGLPEQVRGKKSIHEALVSAGIHPDEVTTLIYPASGNYEARLLSLFKTKVFHNLTAMHLDDPGYHERYAVHDTLAGRRVGAGELVQKGIEKHLQAGQAQGQPPVKIYLYDTRYEDTEFDFNSEPSAGRRVWIDKGPGWNAQMRSDPEFYLSTLRRGIVRPGDLVLSVPFVGLDHRRFWSRLLGNQLYVPDYYDFLNWEAFLVTEQDFEVLSRSEVRSTAPVTVSEPPDDLSHETHLADLEKKVRELLFRTQRTFEKGDEMLFSYIKGAQWLKGELYYLEDHVPDAFQLFRVQKMIERVRGIESYLKTDYRRQASPGLWFLFAFLGGLAGGFYFANMAGRIAGILLGIFLNASWHEIALARRLSQTAIPEFLMTPPETPVPAVPEETASAVRQPEAVNLTHRLDDIIARINKILKSGPKVVTREDHEAFLRSRLKSIQRFDNYADLSPELPIFNDPHARRLDLIATALVDRREELKSVGGAYIAEINRAIMPALLEAGNPWVQILPSMWDWLYFPTTYHTDDHLYEERIRQFLAWIDTAPKHDRAAEQALLTRFGWYGPHLRKDNDGVIDQSDHALRQAFMSRVLPVLEKEFETAGPGQTAYAKAFLNGLLFPPSVSDFQISENVGEYFHHYLLPAVSEEDRGRLRGVMGRAFELLDAWNLDRGRSPEAGLALFLRFYLFELTDWNLYTALLYDQDTGRGLSGWDIVSGNLSAEAFIRTVFNPQTEFKKLSSIKKLFYLKGDMEENRINSLGQRSQRERVVATIERALRRWAFDNKLPPKRSEVRSASFIEDADFRNAAIRERDERIFDFGIRRNAFNLKEFKSQYLDMKSLIYIRPGDEVSQLFMDRGFGPSEKPQVFLPYFIEWVFRQAEVSEKSRILFLKAGADPLADVAETVANVTGLFPPERIHRIWATMGMDSAMRTGEMDPAFFVQYLQDEGVFDETDHLLFVDTDTRVPSLGTETLFYRTLAQPKVMQRLGRETWNWPEPSSAALSMRGLYLQADSFFGDEMLETQVHTQGFDLDDFNKRMPVASYEALGLREHHIADLMWLIDQSPKKESVSNVLIERDGRIQPDSKPPYGQDLEGAALEIRVLLRRMAVVLGTLDWLEAQGYDVTKEAERQLHFYEEEIAKIAAMRSEMRQALVEPRSAYAVYADLGTLAALSGEAREEIYKLMYHHAGSRSVRFYIGLPNAPVLENKKLEKVHAELREFSRRMGNLEWVHGERPQAARIGERRLITLEKEAIRSAGVDYLKETLPGSRALLKVRYTQGQSDTGLLAAALLLWETREPATWKLAAGGYLMEVPDFMRDVIGNFLQAYLAVGISA